MSDQCSLSKRPGWNFLALFIGEDKALSKLVPHNVKILMKHLLKMDPKLKTDSKFVSQ